MGFGVTELLIIGAIVLVLFGTSKLKSMGSDLGGAIKGFKSAMTDDDQKKEDDEDQPKLQADEPKPVPKASTVEKSQSEPSETKKEN